MEFTEELEEWFEIVSTPRPDQNVDAMMSLDFSDVFRHGILVSDLAASVAAELGESQEFINEIALAGLLHDIGKLKLGKYLYGRKKDVLNVEEMKYMRMHPLFSYNILKKQGGFSNEVLEAVYNHHENYDGSGYPNNKKGEDIPWMARIIRTCDVFSALVSNRTYRAAFDVATAIELMIDEVKNFDMRVFLAFQRVVNGDSFEDMRRKILQMNEVHNVAAAAFDLNRRQ